MKKKMMLAALMNLSLIAAISGNAIAAETDDVMVEMVEETVCGEIIEGDGEEICIEVAAEEEEQEEVILEADEEEVFAEDAETISVSEEIAYGVGADSISTAAYLGLNQSAQNSLTDHKDCDYYKIVLSSTGLLELSFAPVDASSKDIHNGWKLTLLDENGKEIDKQSSVKTFYQFNKLPFEAGSIFYAKVESSAATKSYAATAPYVLKANFVTPQNWEKERNDSVNQANEIGVNDIAYGTIYTSKDVDYYKVRMPQNGILKVNVAPETPNASGIHLGWTVSVLDENGKVVSTKNNVKTSFDFPRLPYAGGSELYIKVSPAATSTANMPENETYRIATNFVTDSKWETENNDAPASADTLTVGNTIVGTMMNNKDADYYKVTIKNQSAVTFSLQPENEFQVGGKWVFGIYKENAMTKNLAGSNTAVSSKNVTVDLEPGTYYVKVGCLTGSAPIDLAYSVKATAVNITVPKAPKLSYTKRVNGSIEVKWNEVSGATGYYVYRSTSKTAGFQKIATITKGNLTYKDWRSMSKNTTYYYKVVAYRTVGSKTLVSEYSTVKGTK